MIGQLKFSFDIGIPDLPSCGSFSGRMAAASRLGLALLGKSGGLELCPAIHHHEHCICRTTKAVSSSCQDLDPFADKELAEAKRMVLVPAVRPTFFPFNQSLSHFLGVHDSEA